MSLSQIIDVKAVTAFQDVCRPENGNEMKITDTYFAADCLYGNKFTWCRDIQQEECDDEEKRLACCESCDRLLRPTTTTTTTTSTTMTPTTTTSTSKYSIVCLTLT